MDKEIKLKGSCFAGKVMEENLKHKQRPLMPHLSSGNGSKLPMSVYNLKSLNLLPNSQWKMAHRLHLGERNKLNIAKIPM